MLRVPDLAPPALGLKVTEIVQLEPAETLVPQVLVWEKSPLSVMLDTVRGALPVFVSKTLCGGLLVPDIWAGKVSDVGVKLAPGPTVISVKLWLAAVPTPLLAVMVIA